MADSAAADHVDADAAARQQRDQEEATSASATGTSGCSASTDGRDSSSRGTREADEIDDDESVDGFGEVNPTRDALQEGILGLLRPTVEALDIRVADTRRAQEELKAHISALQTDLEAIAAASDAARDAGLDFEGAVEKLNNSKRRIVVVANLLQGAQVILNT